MRPLMIRLLLVVLAAAWCLGCGTRKRSVTGKPLLPDQGDDRPVSDSELRRDLEVTVLENYLQLTLGNMEAYADAIARDREVTLLGIGPDDVAVGVGPEDCSPFAPAGRICGISRDRLPIRVQPPCGVGSDDSAPCLEVYSKNLQLQLSRDGSVAWLLDELGYRLPHQGRVASLPLRISAVFVRDVDRWVMVQEHLSYALPTESILALAKQGELAKPRSMPARDIDLGRARVLLGLVFRRLNADAATREDMARAAEQRLPRLGRAWVYEARKLLWPDPRHEHHGPAFYQAPSLAEELGPGTRITLHDVRLAVADSERVAWLAATLSARRGSGDADIEMRVSAVFERGADDQWDVMQMHVSVPVTRSQIEARVLGGGLPTAD